MLRGDCLVKRPGLSVCGGKRVQERGICSARRENCFFRRTLPRLTLPDFREREGRHLPSHVVQWWRRLCTLDPLCKALLNREVQSVTQDRFLDLFRMDEGVHKPAKHRPTTGHFGIPAGVPSAFGDWP